MLVWRNAEQKLEEVHENSVVNRSSTEKNYHLILRRGQQFRTLLEYVHAPSFILGRSLVGRAAGFDPVCWVGSNPTAPATLFMAPSSSWIRQRPAKSRYTGSSPVGASMVPQFSWLEPSAHNRVVLRSSRSGTTIVFIPAQFSGRTAGLYPVLVPDQREVLGSNPSAGTIDTYSKYTICYKFESY